jgi:hypothetical protein
MVVLDADVELKRILRVMVDPADIESDKPEGIGT